MTTSSSDPCDLLAWDTDFFGFNIARVRGERLDEQRIDQIDDWCGQNRVRCLYFLCGIDDPRTTHLAEDNGFHSVDIRLTLELKGPPTRTSSGILTRSVRPEDVSALQDLAQGMYRDSRFYYD